MPTREFITGAGYCELAERWQVDPDTMRRVWGAAHDYETHTGGRRVEIISGWRSAAEQRQLGRRGRPVAADDVSTHRSCPATGVDISLGLLPSGFMKHTWGRIVFTHGLRWGGGSQLDPDTGTPIDWPHVDRGPRN